MSRVTATPVRCWSGAAFTSCLAVILLAPSSLWAADTTPPTTPVVTDDGAYTVTSSKLHATWSSSDAQSGISAYQYLIRQDSTAGTIIVNWTSTGTTASVTRTGLSLLNGKTYYFGVKAKNGAGLWSAVGYSNGIKVDTTAPSSPGRPTEGSTTDRDYDADGSYTVYWSAAADAESGIAAYELQERIGTSGTWTTLSAAISGTSFTVSGRVHGSTYYYQVRAKNRAGTWGAFSLASDGIKVDTSAPSAPGRPTEGSPDQDYDKDGAYTIYWLPAADAESGISAYELQERIGTGGTWTTLSSGIAGTSFAVSGRLNGSTYFYQVRAKNGAGTWGPFSATSDGVTVDTQIPTVSAIGVTNITSSSAALNWTTNELAACTVKCGTASPPTTQCGTTPSGTSHAMTLTGLTGNTTYYVSVSCTDPAGNLSASSATSFTTSTSVPTSPSTVTINGRQLLLQRRNPDGTLAPAVPYIIHGVAWSPAGTETNTDGQTRTRRQEFGKWYRTDIPLMKAMNVNTVRVFMDLGLPGDTDPATGNPLVDGRLVLDEFYRNGIMVIMTADDSTNDVDDPTTNHIGRLERVIPYYKNHPAILLWSLGSEWNINRYFNKFGTADQAAAATEKAAKSVKQLDTNHPVVSSYGTILDKPNNIESYVTTVCPTVDVWSVNEYRGPGFSRLFDQWKFISGKPMFVGEYGIDAYNSTTQAEDQATHAQWVKGLWDELARNLSANSASNAALGGTVFEWNDEWWKTVTGTWWVQDTYPSWHPEGFPDQSASEEWWGIVRIDRTPRQLYSALTSAFGSGYVPPAATRTVTYRAISEYSVYAKFWENGSQMYIGAGASIDGGRGFNIAAIDLTTGRLRDPIQRFDTWGSRDTGTAMNNMIAYLNSVPNGTLLLMAVGDEAGLNNFNSCSRLPYTWVTNAINRLTALGSTRIDEYCYRDQWAMIAIKGQGVALSEALGQEATGTSASTQATVTLP